MICHQESGLLALISDDLCVRVLDTDTYRVVREFYGHRNRILDLTFSFDARWIVSTSLDSTIRTWDLPSGNQVDVFKTDAIATSVSFSPSGDFLATAHVDQVGIFLWSNKSLFSSIALRPVTDDDMVEMHMPTVSGNMDTVQDEEEEELLKGDLDQIVTIQVACSEDVTTTTTPSSCVDIVEDMISLSSQPKSKWQTLLNIEAIKKRNKPKEAPKVPEKAPFFLPTVPGATPMFFDAKSAESSSSGLDSAATTNSSKVLKMNDMELVTEFTRILRSCAFENDCKRRECRG
jgi:U3 small nucleolar RNA-associated protein 21